MLNDIIASKKQEVTKAKREKPFKEYPLPGQKGTFKKALNSIGISLIAEIKKASPSKGILNGVIDPVQLAQVYQNAGAAAISVLTESRFFKGNIKDLSAVKEEVCLPVLRKDFIIDPYQIYESRYIGADAVLLIVSVLSPSLLKDFMKLSEELGLDALVEVHSKEELFLALDCGAEIIGINNRDLNTFLVDINTTLELADLVPSSCVLVSESGIYSGIQVKRLAQAGVDAVLVGEALVTASNVDEKVKGLIGRG